jgi:ubiquinone/menaquinone biosynthesis C-methylase UbiE
VWGIADSAKMLLDVGCGYAHYTRSSKAETVIGIDLDENALKEAYLFGGKRKFHVILCDASILPFRDHVFDTIIATEVLEHVPRDDLAVKEMHRVSKRKGKLLITTPCGDFLPRPDIHHIRHYKEKEITFLLTPYFELAKITKRFDKSFLMISCFTSSRDRALRYFRKSTGTTFTKSRIDYMSLVLFAPFLIALAPFVNLTVLIENYLKSGKYNLIIECTRK